MAADGRDAGYSLRSMIHADIAAQQIPIRAAALCEDCEIIFRIREACPGCASRQWSPVTSWVPTKNMKPEAIRDRIGELLRHLLRAGR